MDIRKAFIGGTFVEAKKEGAVADYIESVPHSETMRVEEAMDNDFTVHAPDNFIGDKV